MHVVVLAGFLVSLTLMTYAPTTVSAGWAGAAWAVYLAGTAAIAAGHCSAALRALRDRAGPPADARRSIRLFRLALPAWQVAGGGAVVACGWGGWLLSWPGVTSLPLVGTLPALLPFLSALVVGWIVEYPYHRAVRSYIAAQQRSMGRPVTSVWSLGEMLIYNLRHHVLFVLAPVSLILLATESLQLYVAPLVTGLRYGGLVLAGGAILVAGSVFFIAPLMIVRIWKTSPLPPGELRDELQALCNTLGLGHRDILVWHSGGILANAGVVGVAGPVRYVLLSDGLIQGLNPMQIRAVFAHEAGHIVFHHIFFAALFAVSSVLLCGSLGDLTSQLLREVDLAADWSDWIGGGLAFGLLGAGWWIGFGHISRCFERQSDVIGAALSDQHDVNALRTADVTPQGAYTFATALEEVGRLNGISRRQRNWRHGTLASRVAYVLDLAGRGGSSQDIHARVRRIKRGLWALTALAGAVTAAAFLMLS